MYTGVLMMPLLPYISDTESNIAALLTKFKDLQVDFVMPGGLTLRPGRQKELFLNLINTRFPEYAAHYQNLYRENRPSGAPLAAYSRQLTRLLNRLVTDVGISPLVPHYVYKNRLPLYDEVTVLLSHMATLYSWRGIDTTQLHCASRAYAAWLESERKRYRSKKTGGYAACERTLREMIADGTIDLVLSNKKLSRFLLDATGNGACFDYVTLKCRTIAPLPDV
jgi:DNA repair photolyase